MVMVDVLVYPQVYSSQYVGVYEYQPKLCCQLPMDLKRLGQSVPHRKHLLQHGVVVD